jgi:hypothetical protein
MSDKTTVLEPRMPDFILYCAEQERELPMGDDKDAANENRKRTGAKEGLYPPQYYAGQYPALWKVPAAADSPYYQSINKR